MRLADFIDANTQAILAEWDVFASSLLPAAAEMDAATLRDHAEQILHAVAKDLRTSQTRREQSEKSKGRASARPGATETAAQTHAVLRAGGGFTIRQLVAEYRALRASVLRLWGDTAPYGPQAMEDAGRFNEAIDQAITESVDYFTSEVDRWRAVFLGMLGHDLRGPLNAVLLTSRVISTLSAGTPMSPHTERLMRSGERMRQLLDDLLDYNRTSLDIGIRVTPHRVDLARVCREEIELLQAALPASTIEFATEGVTQGSWDASRVKQVVSNLVINAVRHGNPSGIVRMSLRGDEAQVHLSVENTGPTIPKELMSSLFEPLRRHAGADAQGERASLGLGLFIVRQIAIAHGGSVSVESAGGRTCFTVMLPRK
ncbi:sensor histidine kinase [Schlegelella sp. S2-27]|uniref:histidine kinase n=1 Tax=Caldimonas mangrovi TaxID=2944811 RepID=A0ABT0YVN0_9BURK|nr:sensor histidine kinase [Caldimonas mangrovi]MCM5682797.1 sensor histidine kinase [Caldimonas mangrovi]